MADAAQSSAADRFARRHGTARQDNRNEEQIDRDRVMYTPQFRRLANITQVVAADDLRVFHNRLTHSLLVAQVARRTAEYLRGPSSDRLLLPNADVCETAALAHDLGHPPFGHRAETALNEMALAHGLKDGFEGNAQSFRIVTRLAPLEFELIGLDLTRASLNAILKYPWLKGENIAHPDKWGAYHSEKDELDWARQGLLKDAPKSLEAQIMDWADDVTYAVHDVADFYRAKMIPLDRLGRAGHEREDFMAEVFSRERARLPASEHDLKRSFSHLSEIWALFAPYVGSHSQRNTLTWVTSELIGGYVTCVRVVGKKSSEPRLRAPTRMEHEIFWLKQLTWHYVILSPALVAQQKGQDRVIRSLFSAFHEAAIAKNDSLLRIFPRMYQETLRILREQSSNETELVRIVVDMIANMTEGQALAMNYRLNGTNLGLSLSHPMD